MEGEIPELVPLLAVDRAVAPGPRNLTLAELADRAGTTVEVARRYLRAMGVPEQPVDQPGWSVADADFLARQLELVPPGDAAALDVSIQRVRVLSAAYARIAEVLADLVDEVDPRADPAALAEEIERGVLTHRRLLDHTRDVQVRLALRRRAASRAPGRGGRRPTTVLFADLVGYTDAARRLEPVPLTRALARFEARVHEAALDHRARLVKTLGDGALVEAPEPVAGVRCALAVVAAQRTDEVLPEVRVGLAHGPVLAFQGDCYGPTVNLASRLTAVAEPGRVVVDGDTRRVLAVAGAAGLAFGEPFRRALAGLGEIAVVEVDAGPA